MFQFVHSGANNGLRTNDFVSKVTQSRSVVYYVCTDSFYNIARCTFSHSLSVVPFFNIRLFPLFLTLVLRTAHAMFCSVSDCTAHCVEWQGGWWISNSEDVGRGAAAVAHFKVLSRHSPGGTVGNHNKRQS